MKAYPAYKPSPMPWLDKVPAHWGIMPAFSVLREKRHKNKGMIENTVLSLSYGNIVIKPPEKLHGLVPESFETYQIVDPQNIIIRPTDLQNDWTSLRVGLSSHRGIITSAYICLKAFGEITPEYAYLLLHTYDLLKVFYGMGSGLRQNLDFADLKRMPVLLPSLDEQRAIVAYLDSKLTDIDRYITEKERLIELLQEQKTALINQAVTRGLNPLARMKSSGIEYLGEIPEHWQIVSNRRLFRENTKQEPDGTEIPLSLSQKDGIVATDDLKEKTLLTASRDNFKVCLPHDLIANRFKAHLGVFFEVKVRGVVTFHYGVYCPLTNARTKYFEHLFHSEPYRMIYAGVSNGMVVGLQNLSNQSFYSVKSIIPPIEEQDEILEYVEKVNTELDKAIDMNWNQIEKMQEYRTALIAEAVTGKIDVRETVTVHE
jgi:type I restriction enzyme S subunit